MFDKTFFKFLFGFLAIIVIGLAGVVISKAYTGSDSTVQDLLAHFFR